MPRKIIVNDSHRKNDLSLTPGGDVVTLVYSNGERRVYDKIKNVTAYANRSKANDAIIEIWCGEELIWKREINLL
jgi:hypothetical protein